MKKIRATFKPIQAALFVAIAFFAQQTFAQGNRPPSDVNIVNEPTVNVGNSITIDNIDLPVTIQNDDLNPIPVESVAPTRVPFQASGSDFGSVGSFIIDIPVPAGTDRLVIEQVYGRAVMGAGATGIRLVTIQTTLGGTPTSHFLNMQNMSNTGFGDNWVVDHHAVRLYADPGTNIRFLVTGDPVGSVNIFGNFSVSGYLIPTDSQSLAP